MIDHVKLAGFAGANSVRNLRLRVHGVDVHR